LSQKLGGTSAQNLGRKLRPILIPDLGDRSHWPQDYKSSMLPCTKTFFNICYFPLKFITSATHKTHCYSQSHADITYALSCRFPAEV